MRPVLTLATALFVLALACCGPTATTPSSDSQPSTSITVATTKAATAAAPDTPGGSTTSTQAESKPATAAACDPGPDVIIWYQVPTPPDQAQRVASRGYPNCSSTFDMIQTTSPTGPGDCTEAALASDNPGYDENATPAKRLRKVQVRIGPGC